MSLFNKVCQCVVVIAPVVATGCATTQSAAFRRMSAVDHDSASRVPPSDPEAAAEHTAAARQLRDAERLACAGVSDAERLHGPLAQSDRIISAATLRERLFPKGMLQPVGVAIYLRAERGMTEQWLGRVTECNLAHYAVVGRSEGDRSPLSVPDANVTVSSTGDGFRIVLTSKDSDVAHALIAKSQNLTRTDAVQVARSGNRLASNVHRLGPPLANPRGGRAVPSIRGLPPEWRPPMPLSPRSVRRWPRHSPSASFRHPRSCTCDEAGAAA